VVLNPLYNPIGFGTADFVELGTAAALVSLAAWSTRVEAAARAFAGHRVWSMLLLAALPVALRLALLPSHPVPFPDVYDEFGHLLVADTLRHWRLANPPHPFHRFFETFFVLQEPSYGSIYPLGQGIALALGQIVFGNPCLTSVQAARWLESAKYNCCPCYAGGDIERLVEMYKERHKISIDLRDWTSALVQFAVPYAKHRIVVVVPDHFVVGANASRDARTYGLQLDVLPLSYFSAWDIRKMRKQYLVEALDADGRNYPSELERLLGESKDAHFMMLPQRVREQLTLEG